MLVKYQQGDIVAIPIAETSVAFAQILMKMRRNIFIAVFFGAVSSLESPDLESLNVDDPRLVVETMDLRVRDGSWRIVGRRTPAERLLNPIFKVPVGIGEEFHIQDIYGTVGRPASPQEVKRLRMQKSYSPAVVEKAARALHGLEPWLAIFDELRPGVDL